MREDVIEAPPRARAARPRGRRTVAKLVVAATEEFAAHGYHGARIARITKRAGTAYGTFYLYFADKEDILWQALEESRHDFQDVLNALPPLEHGDAGRQALEEWMYRLCDVFQRHGPMIRALTDVQASSAVIAKRGVRLLNTWRDFLAERIRDSDAAGIDPSLAALVIWAALERTNYMYFSGSLVTSYRDLVVAMTEFVHLSLFGVSSESADAVP